MKNTLIAAATLLAWGALPRAAGAAETDTAPSPLLIELSAEPATSDGRFLQTSQLGVSHTNLFGKGKIIELQAGLDQSGAGSNYSSFAANAEYVDPHPFGSAQWFGDLGAHSTYYQAAFNVGPSAKANTFDAYLNVGRRVFDASYVTLGYEQVFAGSFAGTNVSGVSAPTSFGASYSGTGFFVAAFGCNTLDDAVLPHDGFVLNFDFGVNPFVAGAFKGGIQYRKYWGFGEHALLVLNVGTPAGFDESPVFAAQAALGAQSYPFSLGFAWDVRGAVRARLVAEAGFNGLGLSRLSNAGIGMQQDFPGGPGVSLGVSVKTGTFGLINLRLAYEINGVTP